MFSVIFSTHNGGRDLVRMLDALVSAKPPAGGWKLIAVDNASDDGSGDVLRSYADRLPIIVLHEPAKGKNVALNRALEAAQGDFYVFTDDDVLPGDEWLVQWRLIADAQPDFHLFAGLTSSLFPSEPPAWMLKGIHVGVVFAGHYNEEEGPCDVLNMYGNNMAIRASIFEAGTRFNEKIGPDGSSNYAMGSETDLVRNLNKQGYACWFAKGPEVKHIVPAEAMNPDWILRRAYRWGRGLAQMGFAFHCPPDVLARKNTLKMIAYPFLLPALPRDNRWRRQWQCMVDRGYEDGTRHIRNQKLRWSKTKSPARDRTSTSVGGLEILQTAKQLVLEQGVSAETVPRMKFDRIAHKVSALCKVFGLG